MTLKGWVRGEKTSTVGVAQHVGGDGVVVRQWERQSRSRHRVGALIDISESLDLESLSHLEERREMLLVHRHLSSIHKL